MDLRGTLGGGTTQLGVEHEYQLWRRGAQVDFRRLITSVAGDLRRLDPGDPRARRLPSDVALTADGWEAELATPPVDVHPGVPQEIDQLLRVERTELRAAAGAEGVDRITGFSTHLNITVPDDEVVSLGLRFAQHCLPALADVMEPNGSAGLFVRPRRGRLEVGGEYVEGADLVAALTLLTGCVDALRWSYQPPAMQAPALVASREKFGWYAPDLPQGQLLVVWPWARPFVVHRGLDPTVVDDLATGVRPLPREGGGSARCTFGGPRLETRTRCATGQRKLPTDVRAETEWLTWHHVVWVFQDSEGRRCRAVVPACDEEQFLAALDAGAHDADVSRMLERPWPHKRLLVHAQLQGLQGVTWWHEVRAGALVAAPRLADGSVPRVSRRRAARDLRVRSRSRL